MQQLTKIIREDWIMAGAFFGLVANLIKMILDIILYTAGFSQFFCFHVTAGTILTPQWFDTVHGIIIGAGMDYIIAAFLGVALAFTIYYVPSKQFFLKGIGFSLFIWVFMCIMTVEKVSMWRLLTDPWHAYQSFIVHQVWGIVATYLLLRYNQKIKEKYQ